MSKWKLTTGKNGSKAIRIGSTTLLVMGFNQRPDTVERLSQEEENQILESIVIRYNAYEKLVRDVEELLARVYGTDPRNWDGL